MILLRLAVRDAVRDTRRTLLSIAALAPVVAAFLIQSATSAGLRDEDVSPLADNVILVSADALDPAAGKLDPSVLDVPLEVGGDDIVAYGPVIFRAMRVEDVVMQMRAAPVDQWRTLHSLDAVEGRLPEPGLDEVAISEGIAIATGWNVGDRVTIFGTSFEITALVRASGTKFASVWMDFSRAERLFEGLGGFQMVSMRLRPGADVAEVIDRFDAVAENRYVVYRESALAAQHSARGSASVEISLMALLIGGAALAFGSFNLAALTLVERRRDIGIVRTLGFSRRAVGAFVVLRSAAIALPAFLVGSGFAFVVTAMSDTTTLRNLTFRAAIPPSGWILAVTLTFGVTSLAALTAFSVSVRRRVRDLLGSA